MFCPGCGAQNERKTGYCRQCGQALSAVWLALEGSADQSFAKLKAGEKWISGGTATLVAFALIAVALMSFGVAMGDPTFSYIAFLNLFIGSVIGLPLIYAGKSKLKRATLLLSKSQTESGQSTIEQAQRPDNLLTTPLRVDLPGVPAPGSVTDHTTLDLQKRESVRHKSS